MEEDRVGVGAEREREGGGGGARGVETDKEAGGRKGERMRQIPRDKMIETKRQQQKQRQIETYINARGAEF